jgi:predicted Kef-type K+ transport protein
MMLQINRQTWTVIIGCTVVVYLIAALFVLTRTGMLGGVALIDIGFMTAIVCVLGIMLNWRRNRSIALGFLGSLISIFIVVPSLIVLGAWLLLRNVYF